MNTTAPQSQTQGTHVAESTETKCERTQGPETSAQPTPEEAVREMLEAGKNGDASTLCSLLHFHRPTKWTVSDLSQIASELKKKLTNTDTDQVEISVNYNKAETYYVINLKAPKGQWVPAQIPVTTSYNHRGVLTHDCHVTGEQCPDYLDIGKPANNMAAGIWLLDEPKG